MQSIYAAKMGLCAQQRRMDVLAANVANVETVGYKRQEALFRDALYTQMTDPSNTASRADLMQGSGTLLSSTYMNFDSGTPLQTGRDLDLFINGDGFFTVEKGAETVYTRSGAFKLSDEDGGGYIVTADGSYILDDAGARILIPDETEKLTVGQGGELYADGVQFAALGIVKFVNKDGLEIAGNSCYAASEISGAPTSSEATVQQGCLEASNVDISTEIAQMIRAQRMFSLAGAALSAWNSMESVTNGLRT